LLSWLEGHHRYYRLAAREIAALEALMEIAKCSAARLADLGIEAKTSTSPRRDTVKACLDWSARIEHLAGTLGAALLTCPACGKVDKP
jgi:Ser/Thr protein kinase RdoA (MazF antagonist)